ncbi:hypothetical protein RQP46_005431 [Phenoliferia psychrophenolica]
MAGLGIEAAPSSTGATAGAGPGGFAKLLSFPWHRGGDKASKPTSPTIQHTPAFASPADIYAPLPSPPLTSVSRPFPGPPAGPRTRPFVPTPPSQRIVQHASAAVLPPKLSGATSVSTMSTSSSFASTALFTDDWESEDGGSTQDSSIASSPEGSQPRRMWKVRDDSPQSVVPTPSSPLRSISSVVEEAPETPHRKRNSAVASAAIISRMLADPATPPRLVHRLSASSKPSPTSPPFDPLFEQAVAEGRTRTFPPSPRSPEESGDADDEVSPPRARRGMRRASLGSRQELMGQSLNELVYSDGLHGMHSRPRIPSIRFEGISMDAVFAEVEKKMGDEKEKKASRRRTRVLSTYRPFGSDASLGSTATSPGLSTSQNSLSTLSSSTESWTDSQLSLESQLAEQEAPHPTIDRSQSTTPTPRSYPTLVSHARPLPRRSSSRPAPLNVAAANAIATSAPRSSPVLSPRTPTPRSPALSPRSPLSPATANFSPGSLGDAFSPYPSPALSSTSTFRGPPSPIPELWVRPPTPERALPSPRLPGPMGPYSISNPGTKVVVVQEKRQIKMSSRASTIAKRRPTLTFETAPPASPSLPAYATPPAIPSFGNLGPTPAPLETRRNSIGGSSGEEDPSDVEEALNSMLLRLAQPHTPPTSPFSVTRKPVPLATAPLTLHSLALHTSQLSLASQARSPTSPTFPATPEPISPTSSAERRLSIYSDASSDVQQLSTEFPLPFTGARRGSESDDSATRFGDAPAASQTLPSRGFTKSLSVDYGIVSTGTEAPRWADVAMPDEIRVTPATPSHSAKSSISSAYRAGKSDGVQPTVLHSRIQAICPRESLDESSEESESPSEESEGSEIETESELDGYESTDLAEAAVVMMGERISCGYDIGVAV